eukprot:Plantae.Rhodophyta-Rhodochaete_pulchella.ctg4189.p1 GENE.Plantae.Rhodophyta-Rhodochaete_pulchella.ctg4189~~Plantae.Rhodophyta-Rhodochaete_pulchella.ctg4189.p1  ORF type:complete len:287 (-),score=15.97 Plantae.Rhodophyta-Rhodochaete_pulchella.ctg4189:502-1362(-)
MNSFSSQESLALKLSLPLYGLSESGRYWYYTISGQFESKGMPEAAIDPAILWKAGGDPFVFERAFGMVVDDNLDLGDESFQELENEIYSQFENKGRRHLPFTFDGVDISSVENGLRLSQENYLQKLPDLPIHPNFKQFQVLRGKIAWAALNTRLDILAEVGTCAQVTEATFSDKDVTTLRALVSSVRSPRTAHFLWDEARNQDILKSRSTRMQYTQRIKICRLSWATWLDLQTTLTVFCLSPRDRSRAKIRFTQSCGLNYWHYAKVMICAMACKSSYGTFSGAISL